MSRLIHRDHRLSLALCLFCLSTTSVLAQRELQVIPPPDPEIERQTFEVPEGVEVNLFAADPALAKPIQMAWDERGRLWIAGSETYPQIEPGQASNDKILIVEDLDKDGVSDRTTVFADGLLIPTGVLPGDGGVYVANSTELVHFSDTDGDGKADRRRVMLSGFGTEDTHHILHSFRWGPDGALFFNQSIYIHSHVETIHGPRRLNAGGIWRYHPDSMNLEVFARGWVNAWGHAFDEFGQSFVTDGAGGEGINYAIPGAAYVTAQGVPRIFHGLNPGSPKYCGLDVVHSPAFPADWQGQLVTHDFRGNRVCRFELQESGAGYVSRQLPDLIRSSHVAFRPVDVKMGPDGAIYIADWYNPIIQHGEVDFRDPRRDHVHGRIWRVTFKGQQPVAPRDLAEASHETLAESVGSGNAWSVEQSRRLLRERGPETLAALTAWRDAAPDAATRERRDLELLWGVQSAGQIDVALLDEVLAAGDGRIRAAGVRVLADWAPDIADPLSRMMKFVNDEHPRVRLEALRGLSEIDDPAVLSAALNVLEHPMDEFLDYALWLTLWQTHQRWLPALADQNAGDGIPPEHLVLALEAAGADQAVPLLLELLRKSSGMSDGFPVIARTVSRLGNAPQFGELMKIVALPQVAPAHQAQALSLMADAAYQRKIKFTGDPQPLVSLLDAQDDAVRAGAVRLAGQWRVPGIQARLKTIAESADESIALRAAAIGAYGQLGAKTDPAPLLAIVNGADTNPAIKMSALHALADLNLGQAADSAVAWIMTREIKDTPEDEAFLRQLASAFLQRQGGSQALAATAATKELPAVSAKLLLRAVSGSGSPHPELAELLMGLSKTGDGWIALDEAARAELVSEVVASGDPHHGEAVYRRESLSCMRCHAIGGSGGKIGPDLLSLGAASQPDYVLESLIDPNRKVKENFHTLVVVDFDGRVHTGIKLRESDKDMFLRDVNGVEIRIPIDRIDDTAVGSSLMPVGLVDRLTRRELIDLTSFLSSVGKRPEFSVGTEQKLRSWQVMQPTEEAAFRLRRTSYGQAAIDDPAFTWKPLYSKVNGELPLEDLPGVSAKLPFGPFRATSFVRGTLPVASDGRLALVLNDVAGLQLWINADPIPVEPRVELQLPAGDHRVTFAIDTAVRKAPLAVLVEPIGDSAGE